MQNNCAPVYHESDTNSSSAEDVILQVLRRTRIFSVQLCHAKPEEVNLMDSLWTKTVQMPHFEALGADIKTDVLIIGGGMAGILCAYQLSRTRWPISTGEPRHRVCRERCGFIRNAAVLW